MAVDLKALPDCCEEASPFSAGIYIPCNAPAVVWVKHRGRNERIYRMCAECASHNEHHRNAEIICSFSKGVDINQPSECARKLREVAGYLRSSRYGSLRMYQLIATQVELEAKILEAMRQ